MKLKLRHTNGFRLFGWLTLSAAAAGLPLSGTSMAQPRAQAETCAAESADEPPETPEGKSDVPPPASEPKPASAENTSGEPKVVSAEGNAAPPQPTSPTEAATPPVRNPIRLALSVGGDDDAAGTSEEKDDINVNRLRLEEPQTKPAKKEGELTLEEQQAKDAGECPGSEKSKVSISSTLDDIPLEQEEHPFDAPAAESELSDTDASVEPPRDPHSTPKADPQKISPTQARIHKRINECLAHYVNHPENLARRSPWAVMHTILPYGVETEIIAGNRPVNAIGWMCYNGVCKTQRMFQPTNTGFRTNVGPGVQGHEGQFLAVLAQSSVPRDFPLLVGKTQYTVNDLIRYEMVTCREKSELTFKLIGLSHYLQPRQTWRDNRGQTWNLEKLVREELEQPVIGAACGGTHRLMGLSYALSMRRRYQEPITGHWSRADVYVRDFIQYAWSMQNPDGSFSTDWFEGRANEPDMERKVQTSGHILEWLIFTLPAEDLNDPRITRGIEFLLSQIYDHREHDWPIGPRGHSLRALALYNKRVFGVPTGQIKSHLAGAGLMKDLR